MAIGSVSHHNNLLDFSYKEILVRIEKLLKDADSNKQL